MTESATILWSVPECPFRIDASARVLDDIRLAVVDAFFSLPRGGAEIGGILLGNYQAGLLSITGYAPLDCEHAFGPSFTLSPPDEARLQKLLALHAAGEERPVGWYHSHTRSEIFLSDADLEIHKRYFPEPWQVALVIKPHTFQPARIGFFFREADRQMRTDASYREELLEPLPIRQVPNGTPTAPPPHVQRYTAAVTPLPPPPHEPPPVPEAKVELPTPQFLVPAPPPSRRWMWMIALGAGLGVGAAGFQTRNLWLPSLTRAVRPAPTLPAASPSLGLTTIDRDGQLQINWDGKSAAIARAADAILEIADGGALPQAIQLDRAHLQAGSFTYARQSEKVDVKLTVHRPKASDVREVTSFLGKLPNQKPVEDPEVARQRDELAKQAAKLKTDLNAQAAKTRKLEKDLESVREEMKQQQMKRLTNQVPDK